jgi:nitrate/nitrite transport system ATP-binding protein
MRPSRKGLAAVKDQQPPAKVVPRDPAADARYLEFSRLSKSFTEPPEAAPPVVENFDLTIAKGEFVCLIGHSGCGKSTVLSIAAGLSSATLGGVLLDGREVSQPGTDRGVVFQSPCLLPWMTAAENVMLGVSQVFSDLPRRKRREIVEHYLALVGLGDALDKKPGELSAGMRQRVGIARAFALQPKVLLLDEPFGMLDSLTRLELQDTLLELLDREGLTALMVTHDVDEALFLSDRIICMTDGPAAGIGEIVQVDFPRPRFRKEVMEHPDYYKLRAELIEFLELRAHRPAGDVAPAGLATPAKAGQEQPAVVAT